MAQVGVNDTGKGGPVCGGKIQAPGKENKEKNLYGSVL